MTVWASGAGRWSRVERRPGAAHSCVAYRSSRGPARSPGPPFWRASGVHDGEAPAPSGELAGDRDAADRGALVASVEGDPALVQAAVCALGPLAYRRRLAFAAADQLAAWPVGSAVMPGGLDQQSARVRVAGLGDRALAAALPRGVLARYQAEVGADRGSAEALPVADLNAQRKRGQHAHSAQAAEPPDAVAPGWLCRHLGDRAIEPLS